MSNTINVADQVEKHPLEDVSVQLEMQTKLFANALSDIWAIITKLLTMNLFSDVAKLIDMIFTNPGSYTVAQLKSQIMESLAKLKIFPDGTPIAPKLVIEDEKFKLSLAKPATKPEAALMVSNATNAAELNPAGWWALVQMGLKSGLDLLKAYLEWRYSTKA